MLGCKKQNEAPDDVTVNKHTIDDKELLASPVKVKSKDKPILHTETGTKKPGPPVTDPAKPILPSPPVVGGVFSSPSSRRAAVLKPRTVVKPSKPVDEGIQSLIDNIDATRRKLDQLMAQTLYTKDDCDDLYLTEHSNKERSILYSFYHVDGKPVPSVDETYKNNRASLHKLWETCQETAKEIDFDAFGKIVTSHIKEALELLCEAPSEGRTIKAKRLHEKYVKSKSEYFLGNADNVTYPSDILFTQDHFWKLIEACKSTKDGSSFPDLVAAAVIHLGFAAAHFDD